MLSWAVEYEPLFEPGFYDVPFAHFCERLHPLLVDGFNNSQHRDILLRYLHILLKKAESVHVFVEAWIDGSFVSKKEKPNDVDIVLLYKGGIYLNSLSPSARKTYQELQNLKSWKEEYYCDLRLVEIEEELLKEYYQNFFGVDRANRPKGIIRIVF